jgi:hypothetical protein
LAIVILSSFFFFFFFFLSSLERPQLSLGDARSYFLSTAANHLGVISATSAAGKSIVSCLLRSLHPTSPSKTLEKGKNPVTLSISPFTDCDLTTNTDSEG